MSDLAAALQIAIKVHAGQVDKQGEPYLLHVLRVAEAVEWGDERVASVLHDVIKHSNLTVEEVVAAVEQEGFRRRLTGALGALNRSDESYVAYIDRIASTEGAAGHIARAVKLADLRDNLRRIPTYNGGPAGEMIGANREWVSLKARYEKAIEALEGASGILSSHPKGEDANKDARTRLVCDD